MKIKNFPMALVVCLILLSTGVFASDISPSVIRFDESPFIAETVFCEEEQELIPEDNDFEILSYALMSSGKGDRFVLANIKNKSAGQRILRREHLVAIFADCSQRHPTNIQYKLDGGGVITREINFGNSRFPIIKVISKIE